LQNLLIYGDNPFQDFID